MRAGVCAQDEVVSVVEGEPALTHHEGPATHDRAPLKHQHLTAGLRHEGARRQAGDAPAYDDDIRTHGGSLRNVASVATV